MYGTSLNGETLSDDEAAFLTADIAVIIFVYSALVTVSLRRKFPSGSPCITPSDFKTPACSASEYPEFAKADTHVPPITRAAVKITAKIFIDCSGDADMAYAAGVPMQNSTETQSSSLFFTVGGVDKAAMDKHMLEAHNMEEKFYMKEIITEREQGRFPISRAKIALYESTDGSWRVNMSQLDNVDSTKPEEVTSAEIAGRKQIKYIMDFLKNNVAGCERITLIQSAPALGVRESRRIVGEYILTLEDISVGKRFEDSVFCCSNSIDIHKKGGVDYIPTKLKGAYYIPYRSLLAKSIDNLLVAGRCISADRTVMAAIRVMPPCFAMGQAAGTAAALSLNSEACPKNISVAELTDALIADGVYLP